MKYKIINLVNSAVMVQPGDYGFRLLEPEEFKSLFFESWDGQNLRSYVGYPNCKKMLERLLDGQVDIPLSREATIYQKEHLILGCRLKYRVNPTQKKENVVGEKISEYEFFRILYQPF